MLSATTTLRVLAYLGLLVVAGYALFCLLAGGAKKHPLEILGVSGLLGAAAAPMLLFWFSLAGIKPGREVLMLWFLASVAAIFLLKRANRLVKPIWSRPALGWADGWSALFGVILGWALMVIINHSLSYPLVDLDGFAIWGLKAKALSGAPITGLRDYFQDRSLSFSHLDYPLLLPFLTAGGYAAMGEVHDSAAIVIGLFLLGCYAIFFYAAVRSTVSRPAAVALAAIALSAPAVMLFGAQGTADMPLAIFYAGSVYYLARWIGGGGAGNIRLAGFLGVACVFTKNEGLPLALINLFAAAAFGWKVNPRGRRDLGFAALSAILGLLPWFIFRHSLPHTDENYLGHLGLAAQAENLARLPAILHQMLDQMFFNAGWSYLWWLVAAAFLIGCSQRLSRAAWALGFVLLAQLSLYVFAYVITPYPLGQLMGETIDRLLLQAFPVGLLLAAFSLAKIAPAHDARKSVDPATAV